MHQVVFGSPYDARADVYSFGIVMAEMLCCRIVGSTMYTDEGTKKSNAVSKAFALLEMHFVCHSCSVTDNSFLCAGPANRFKVDLSELRQAAPASCPEALIQVSDDALRL